MMWLHSKNFMDRGVDLSWVEGEYLYPTLSYLKPTSDKPIVVNLGGTQEPRLELLGCAATAGVHRMEQRFYSKCRRSSPSCLEH